MSRSRADIRIRKVQSEVSSSVTEDDTAARSLSESQAVADESAVLQPEIAADDPPEPPADSQIVKDWRAIANEASKASVDEYFKQEEMRASMWRKTRSKMFQPFEKIVVKNKEPLLSNVRFKKAFSCQPPAGPAQRPHDQMSDLTLYPL